MTLTVSDALMATGTEAVEDVVTRVRAVVEHMRANADDADAQASGRRTIADAAYNSCECHTEHSANSTSLTDSRLAVTVVCVPCRMR